MLQNHVAPWSLALVVGAHAASLVALGAVLRTPRSSFPGWRTVGPGGTHWFAFLGSWAFATLISWVWLFVGSARRDAETQMHFALVLILAFGLGAAWSGFRIARLRRTAVRWRGSVVRWHERGVEVVVEMTNFDAARRTWGGDLHLRFHGGSTLKLDPYARHVDELLVAIAEHVGKDLE